MAKKLMENRFIWLTLYITVHHQRKSRKKLKQNRNLESGADIKDKEVQLNVLVLVISAASFFIEPRTTRPRMTAPISPGPWPLHMH